MRLRGSFGRGLGRHLALPGALAVSIVCASIVRAAEAPVPRQVEAAVDKALKWLAANQVKKDAAGPVPTGATWVTASLGRSTAVTSLAVMAFLARGHTPGQGPYGEVIDNGIDFVLASQQPNGVLSAQGGTMYDHGISTVMLCEAYGMLDGERRRQIDAVLPKAVKVILDAQRRTVAQHAGGWRYTPASQDADISCTGWQLMALRGAANCGAAVPRAALDAGVAYVKRNAVPGGGFGYQGPGDPNQARTGTGVLSMALLGQRDAAGALPKEATAGGDWLLKRPMDNPQGDFYYYAVYYCSQAANQLGDKYWDGIYPPLRDTVLKCQTPAGDFARGTVHDNQAGPAYKTAMAVLALCVPYRYLPLYQR